MDPGQFQQGFEIGLAGLVFRENAYVAMEDTFTFIGRNTIGQHDDPDTIHDSKLSIMIDLLSIPYINYLRAEDIRELSTAVF